jgi:hypothetical protein
MPIGDEWESIRLDSRNPERLVRRFAGIVLAERVEPKVNRPKSTRRDFRYPDDLGVFFHPWCAPRIPLPEKIQHEVAEILAQAFIAHYERTIVRWTKVAESIDPKKGPAEFHALLTSAYGRRVFTMGRADWDRFRSHDGQLIEIDLDRTTQGGTEESVAVIAALAAECSVETGKIEVWRYNESARPTFTELEPYLVLGNLTSRRLNLPMFAQRANTQDTQKLRKYLREHVFIVREQSDKGRWQLKARVIERLVFLTV